MMNPILLNVPASMLDELIAALPYAGLALFKGNDDEHYVIKRIPEFIRIKQENCNGLSK
jgi:hypothetical protein